LDALHRGFSVFPCIPCDKLPYGQLVKHGVCDATTNEETVRQWWTSNPACNVGLTGATILDVDTGLTNLADLQVFEADHNLPPTLCIRTGGRPGFRVQLHYLGIAPSHLYDTGKCAGEIRGYHEYGLGAESVHPVTGERYQIVRDLPRAHCPHDILRPFWKHASRKGHDGTDYDPISIWDARELYSQLLWRVMQARQGGRNHACHRLCFFAARALAAGVFEEFALGNDAIVFPLVTEEEIMQQIASAVEPLYRGDRRDWRYMLRYSWDCGVSKGPLLLELYHHDYATLGKLSDDERFQHAFDGIVSDFPSAVAAKDYMAVVLRDVGCTGVTVARILNASRIMETITAQVLFELHLSLKLTREAK